MATKVLAVLAAGLAVLTLVRWWQRPADGPGRRRAAPLLSVALFAGVAALAGIPLVLHARLEATLSAVASELAGRPVTVRCQTPSEEVFDVGTEYGYVSFDAAGRPEPQAVIKTDQCNDLRDFIRSRGTHVTEDQAVAVHVLTHESMHMRGIVDEAVTECAAVQRDALTAELLGALPHNARTPAQTYYAGRYPRMPDGYWSPECRRGGAMDEGLATAPW